MSEESKQIMRSGQCARIILCISEMFNVTIQEATDIYYQSETANLIENGVADLHCRSDKYLATLVWEEYGEKQTKTPEELEAARRYQYKLQADPTRPGTEAAGNSLLIVDTKMTEGYKQKNFGQPVKRYCQTLDLKDNPALIAKYREAHDRYHSWPEIRQGIQEVGILEMEIYILGNRLFMIVETPLDFDWDEAMSRLATLPRQAEWEDYVAMFQACRPGSTSDQKWQMMERMFYLYEEEK